MPQVTVREDSSAMDLVVQGKDDTELLNIMVAALTSNDNALLDKLRHETSYTTNKPDAEIIAAICRHVQTRLTIRVDEPEQS